MVVILVPTAALADSLVIPDIANQPGTVPDNTPRPARAMSMEQVREQFGSPREVLGPVGNPPITRWVYDNYTVYFERDIVLDSVIHHH